MNRELLIHHQHSAVPALAAALVRISLACLCELLLLVLELAHFLGMKRGFLSWWLSRRTAFNLRRSTVEYFGDFCPTIPSLGYQVASAYSLDTGIRYDSITLAMTLPLPRRPKLVIVFGFDFQAGDVLKSPSGEQAIRGLAVSFGILTLAEKG